MGPSHRRLLGCDIIKKACAAQVLNMRKNLVAPRVPASGSRRLLLADAALVIPLHQRWSPPCRCCSSPARAAPARHSSPASELGLCLTGQSHRRDGVSTQSSSDFSSCLELLPASVQLSLRLTSEENFTWIYPELPELLVLGQVLLRKMKCNMTAHCRK